MKTKSGVHILTVIGQDRSGIIAAVTKILYDNHCNLEDVNMTILEGQFAMMMLVKLPASMQKRKHLSKALTKLESRLRITILANRAKGRLKRGEYHTKNSRHCLITAIGKDRTGIVHHISQWLAAHSCNITDLQSKILGYGPKAVYTLLLEADIPAKISPKVLDQALVKIGKNLALDIQVKEVESLTL